MTIYYDGYHATQGTTKVSAFWSDMHILDFRADKVINDFTDLKDVVERFKADGVAFDQTNYNVGAKFIKANREYESFIEQRVDFEVMEFLYQGKKYKLRTRKYFPTVSKVRKMADKVLSHVTEQTICIVSDATGEVFGVHKVLRKLDKIMNDGLI